MILIGQSQAGQTINLPLGEVLELRLAENPTTGFRWTFTSDGRPACSVVAQSFRPDSTAPGAPGEHRWEIRGVHPGICNLDLSYRRGFEQTPPARTFTLHVRVIG
jgi:inhibitor of cysteine peptidase